MPKLHAKHQPRGQPVDGAHLDATEDNAQGGHKPLNLNTKRCHTQGQVTLTKAPNQITKKAESLATADGMQSLKSVTHLIAGVNTLLQQKQDQEDQDDDKDQDCKHSPDDNEELECDSDSDDEEEQTHSDEAELDEATDGRDQHNNDRASIKQVTNSRLCTPSSATKVSTFLIILLGAGIKVT